MGLLADIEAEQSAMRPGGRCSIGTYLDGLDAKERAELEQALTNDGLTTRAIHAVLDRRGHAPSYSSMIRHRAGRCLCGSR